MNQSSFRLSGDNPRSDDILTLKIEALANPEEVTTTTSTVIFYELDNLKAGKSTKNTSAREIARFKVLVSEAYGTDSSGAVNPYEFTEVTRIDSKGQPEKEPDPFPEIEKRNTTADGVTHKDIHFTHAFAADPPIVKVHFSGLIDVFTIVLDDIGGEIENYRYEIGFKVEMANATYSAMKMPTVVNCVNALINNCEITADTYMFDHNKAIENKRGYGTHYGTTANTHLTKKSTDLAELINKLVKKLAEIKIKSVNASAEDKLTIAPIIIAAKNKIIDLQKQKDDVDAQIELIKNRKTNGLRNTDCITYVHSTLKTAHRHSNSSRDWKKITELYNKVFNDSSKKSNGEKEHNPSGLHLAQGLQDANWKCVFFANDVLDLTDNYTYQWNHIKDSLRKNKDKDDPRAEYIDNENTLYEIKMRIDEIVVNYKKTPSTDTVEDTSGLDNMIKKIEFGFIVRESGIHTGMIIRGSIYQVHQDRGPSETDLYDAYVDFEYWAKDKATGLILTPELPSP